VEAAFGIDPTIKRSLAELRTAAEKAQVLTFGSSIAAVLPAGEGSPKPTGDGIIAKYAGDRSATYWTLTKGGLGYLMHTNFEEMRFANAIAVDSQIHRVTELVLHVRNLYTELQASDSDTVSIGIWHGGLTGKQLRFANPRRIDPRLLMQPVRATTDSAGYLLVTKLGALRGDLRPIVKAILNPLFELFDFYEPSDVVYDEIVPAFIAGTVT